MSMTVVRLLRRLKTMIGTDNMKLKVVLNNCYGGFGLSKEAVLLGRKISGDPEWGELEKLGKTWYGDFDGDRHDPVLVEVVETLGTDKASGECAMLVVKEINLSYEITDFDGKERIERGYCHDW